MGELHAIAADDDQVRTGTVTAATTTSFPCPNSSIIGLIVSCGGSLFADNLLCFHDGVDDEHVLPYKPIPTHTTDNSVVDDPVSSSFSEKDHLQAFTEEMNRMKETIEPGHRHSDAWDGDTVSCCSSISSSGKSFAGSDNVHRVRVTFDDTLPTATSKSEHSRLKGLDEEDNNNNNQNRTRDMENNGLDHQVLDNTRVERSSGLHVGTNVVVKATSLNSNKQELEISKPKKRRSLYLYPRDRWSDDESDADDSEYTHGNTKSVGGKVSGISIWKSRMDKIDSGRYDVRVVGTSMNDESTKPRVLTSPIMDALQEHMPLSKQGESFWLKYSLVRDGANIFNLLQKARECKYTILAVETTEGEVFGAFVGQEWHITWGFYGTPESFLWRLKHSRREVPTSRSDQVLMESECEVFKYSGCNHMIQLCKHDLIAIGGGTPEDPTGSLCGNADHRHSKYTEWGFGLSFDEDLLQGTTSPCMTFQSPSLSSIHDNGTRFEVLNMELWTLTPFGNLEEAKHLEEELASIERANTF